MKKKILDKAKSYYKQCQLISSKSEYATIGITTLNILVAAREKIYNNNSEVCSIDKIHALNIAIEWATIEEEKKRGEFSSPPRTVTKYL